ILDALERELGKPVISAASAMMWQALRLAGVRDRVSGYGRLFAAVPEAFIPPKAGGGIPAPSSTFPKAPCPLPLGRYWDRCREGPRLGAGSRRSRIRVYRSPRSRLRRQEPGWLGAALQ